MPLAVYCVVSLWVGFVGGLAYTYSFVLLYEEQSILQQHRDACISLLALAYSFAVLSASALGFVFDVVSGE